MDDEGDIYDDFVDHYQFNDQAMDDYLNAIIPTDREQAQLEALENFMGPPEQMVNIARYDYNNPIERATGNSYNCKGKYWEIVTGNEAGGTAGLTRTVFLDDRALTNYLTNEITSVTVKAYFTNRNVLNKQADTNVANMIYCTFSEALSLGLSRFNMKKRNDRNASNTAYAPINRKGHKYGAVVHTTLGQPPNHYVPMIDANGVPIHIDMKTDNVKIRWENLTIMPRIIGTSLFNHYLLDINEEINNSSYFNYTILAEENKNLIQVNYKFMFQHGVGWQPLTPEQFRQFEWSRGTRPDFLNPPDLGFFSSHSTRLRNIPNNGAVNTPQTTSSGYGNQARTRSYNLRNIGASRVPSNTGGAANMTSGGSFHVDKKNHHKLYMRRANEDFFTCSDACICTPETVENLCIIMSIIRCEKRTWKRKCVYDDNNVTDIENVFTSLSTNNYYRLNIPEDEEIPATFQHLTTPFWEPSTRTIILFNPCKKKVSTDGDVVYENEALDSCPQVLSCWGWCAKLVHKFVEEVIGSEVDKNSLGDCLSAYSYVFEVNISVFAHETGGKRILYFPINGELREKEECIAVMTHGYHCYAISNICKYHLNFTKTGANSKHAYCDFCGDYNNKWTLKEGFKHQALCYESKAWERDNTLDKQLVKKNRLFHDEIIFAEVPTAKKYRDCCRTCAFILNECKCINEDERYPFYGVVVSCLSCRKDVLKCRWNNHICYINAKKHKDPIPEDKIFVYDIESKQDLCIEANQYLHSCILIIMKAVYDDRTWSFQTMDDFVHFLLTEEQLRGATILAHNGGGYDHIFVQKYCEEHGIVHSTIPRPNSIHKCLLLELGFDNSDDNIKLIDFMMLMTNSLKNIGLAFKLDVSKGDFPHNFSISEHVDYVGPLPALDHERDWYGFRTMKDQKDLEEAREYWLEQEKIYCTCRDHVCDCAKPPWNFQEELYKYCLLDVKVLADAVKAYRNEALNFLGASDFNWEAKGIEPLRYMTQSQIALSLFLEGQEKNDLVVSREKLNHGFHPKAICWLESLMEGVDDNGQPLYQIQHAGNSRKPYYETGIRMYVHGYCKKTNTVFYYFDCKYEGCHICHGEKIEANEIHPIKKVPYKIVAEQTQETKNKLMFSGGSRYTNVVIRYSHEDQEEEYHPYLEEASKLMSVRDAFYGGRTEVFASYCNSLLYGEDYEIFHYDVCSLYPFVCSQKELPVGPHEVIFSVDIDYSRLTPTHEDRYFGFVRCKVTPPKDDFLGILPARTKGMNDNDIKLMYDLHPKIGCWHTEFIYLAMKHGYIINEIYEVWHWPKERRSTTLMRGYMEFFLRMKQEAEGWGKLKDGIFDDIPESDLTDEQKRHICSVMKGRNGGFGEPRPAKVDKNPVKRQLAKIFLNCLWGKLCQKDPKEHEQFVYGYQQYAELMNSNLIDIETIKFRHVKDQTFKARFKTTGPQPQTNNALNVFVAASVTAHAQVYLMEFAYKIGLDKILYCDTDSWFFLSKKSEREMPNTGLGNWTDEHPGEKITKFVSLAPKSYMMEIDKGGEKEWDLKCKGVRGTEENRRIACFDNLARLVEDDFLQNKHRVELNAETMIIHPNSTNAFLQYGSLCTAYGMKKIQTVFSKREMKVNQREDIQSIEEMKMVRLTPFGYEGDLTHEYV